MHNEERKLVGNQSLPGADAPQARSLQKIVQWWFGVPILRGLFFPKYRSKKEATEKRPIDDESPGKKELRKRCAQFIQKIYEVGPLECPVVVVPVLGNHKPNTYLFTRPGVFENFAGWLESMFQNLLLKKRNCRFSRIVMQK